MIHIGKLEHAAEGHSSGVINSTGRSFLAVSAAAGSWELLRLAAPSFASASEISPLPTNVSGVVVAQFSRGALWYRPGRTSSLTHSAAER